MSRAHKTQKVLEKVTARVILSPPLSSRFSRKEKPAPRTRKGTHAPKAQGNG